MRGLSQECKLTTLAKPCLLHLQASNHCNMEKVFDKIRHSSLSKLGVERNFLNLIKSNYGEQTKSKHPRTSYIVNGETFKLFHQILKLNEYCLFSPEL